MKTKSNIPPAPEPPPPSPAVRSTRWIARDDTGRELVVYEASAVDARRMFEESKLFSGSFVMRAGGHIDDTGRLHLDEAQTPVLDRRITS